MTTDTQSRRTAAVQFTVGGKTCTIGGICKGSGMIHPNLGTMLVFLTTDCAVTPDMLTAALPANVQKTYNRVAVDGDTSTNDMVAIAGKRPRRQCRAHRARRGLHGLLPGAQQRDPGSAARLLPTARAHAQLGLPHR